MFTTIEDVTEKHSGLICHLTKLLDLFIAMRYVSPSDVIRPPHAPGIIASPLGLEPDVLVLTTLIPWMRTQIVEGYQWFGVELIPRSKAVTYLGGPQGGDLDFMERLRWGERTQSDQIKLLPDHLLRLTHGGGYSGQYGTDLIYNTRDQTIIEWPSVGPTQDTWEDAPVRPAVKVLDEIIEKFENLEWVPYLDPDDAEGPPGRQIIEDPVLFLRAYGARLGFMVPPFASAAEMRGMNQTQREEVGDSLRRRINRWRALQKMYRDCGWGGPDFDGEGFEKRRREYVRVLEAPLIGKEKVEWDAQIAELDRFIVEAAGRYAV